MAHVFISYHKGSSRDYARRLADHLLIHGFDVWIDDRIDYGTEWRRVIFEEGIDKAAAVIVIMTEGAWKSIWVGRECEYAEHRNLPILPLRVEEFIFPLYLSTQFADVRGWKMPPDTIFTVLEAAGVRQSASPGKDVVVSSPPVQYAAPDVPRPLVGRSVVLQGLAILLLLFMVGVILDVGGIATRMRMMFGGYTPTSMPNNAGTQESEPMLQGAIQQTSTAISLTMYVQSQLIQPTETLTPTDAIVGTATSIIRVASETAAAQLTATDESIGATETARIATPNGGGRGQIAYDSNPDGNYEVYLMNIDGMSQRNLTRHSGNDGFPAWSPDGTRLLFMSDRDENWEIYVMNADGSELHNLTGNPAFDGYPAWSPDGNQIVFVSGRDDDWDIYVMNADGSESRNLTQSEALDQFPAWSPDGRSIIFTSTQDGRSRQLYVMNVDGSQVRRLTSDSSTDDFAKWSPDGHQIVFMSDRDGNPEIYLLNLNDLNQHRLSENSADDLFPSWSQDGTQIAFLSNRDGNYSIYTMSIDGTNVRQLVDDVASDAAFAWRP